LTNRRSSEPRTFGAAPRLDPRFADLHEVDPRVRTTIHRVLEWLVASDFDAIERDTSCRHVSADSMRLAVIEYGRTLVIPPVSALDRLDIVEIAGADPKAWSVRVELWTAEEGRSDLSLELTLIDRPGGALAVEVDNLHVL